MGELGRRFDDEVAIIEESIFRAGGDALQRRLLFLFLDAAARDLARDVVIDGVEPALQRRTHAALDYLTTSYFFILAAYFWGSNKRAAATALINGTAVLGVSMFTDYPGALVRKIPFETHGKIDMMQASMAAGLPVLLGFATDAAAAPFEMQAMNEATVIMATDWESAEDIGERGLRRAS